jgi:hypothetical protein
MGELFENGLGAERAKLCMVLIAGEEATRMLIAVLE